VSDGFSKHPFKDTDLLEYIDELLSGELVLHRLRIRKQDTVVSNCGHAVTHWDVLDHDCSATVLA
jgi:hypothetical protein